MTDNVLNHLFDHLTRPEVMAYQLQRLSDSMLVTQLPELPLHRQALVLLLLPDDRAMTVFQQLPPPQQAQLLQELDVPEAKQFWTALTPWQQQALRPYLLTAPGGYTAVILQEPLDQAP